MATYEIDGGTYELPDDITPEQLNSVVAGITGRSTGQRQFERRSFEDILASVRKSGQDEGFDYETGAGSGIRALVSFGETPEEQAAILSTRVGQDGFVRDSRGNLALTPIGQRRLGMDVSDKNIVLEDKGFSFGDVADLAGIAPETIGAITGGILTSPGVITSAGGAAAGAALGQSIEEGIETLLGVQRQTLGEVAGDVATEAAIAGTIDLVTLGTAKAVRGVIGGAGRLASRPLQEAGQEGAERGLRIIDEGGAPSLERLGAPAAIAYAQKLGEGATKDAGRVIANTEFALTKTQKLREQIAAAAGREGDRLADLDEAAGAFANVTGVKFKTLQQTQKEAADAALKSTKESIDLIERSLDEGFDINNETLQSIVASFQNFSRVSGNEFRIMDEMLSKLEFDDAIAGVVKEGGKARIIDTGIIEGAIKDLEEAVGARSVLPAPVQQAMRGIEELSAKGGKASFEQIANQRKLINDAIFDNEIGSATTEQLFKIRDAFDNTLSSVNLRSIKGLRRGQNQQLNAIAKQREKAFASYRDGMKVFDDLQKFGVIRNLKAASKDPRFNVDQFFNKIIRPNSPERLKGVFAAVDDAEMVRSRLARAYLDDAMQKTGVDLMDPTQFNGLRFKSQIDRLGTTGKELFGDNWGEIQRLSNAIAQSGPTRISKDAVDRIVALNTDQPLTKSLQDLLDAKTQLDDALKLQVVRDFDAGTLSAEDAARYIVNPKRSVTEINRIKNFFKDDPDALQKIREYAAEDILSSVGDDVFADTSKALELDRLVNKTYKEGALDALLGKETAEGVRQLAADIAYLGDVGKEGAIVAAQYAAHPISKAGDRLRMKATSKIFANPTIMKKFARRSAGAPDGQATAGKITGALDAAVAGTSAVLRPVRQAGARAIGINPQLQTPGPIREPENEQMFGQNIGSVAQPSTASGIGQIDPTQPLNPNIAAAGNTSSIRQQAAQNPAVAQTLGINPATATLLRTGP